MAYITCKKCGETYDYPDSNPPAQCMFCGASFSEEDVGGNTVQEKTMQETASYRVNEVKITGIQISIKDLIVLYWNALIASLPFTVTILIFYLLFRAAARMD